MLLNNSAALKIWKQNKNFYFFHHSAFAKSTDVLPAVCCIKAASGGLQAQCSTGLV